MASDQETSVFVRAPRSAISISDREPEPDRNWMLLGLSDEMRDRVEKLAMRNGDSIPDLLNKAVGLYKVVTDALDEGKKVGIAGPEQPLELGFEGL